VGALDGIVAIDWQSRVLEWNPAAEDIFGIRRDEAVGRLLPDLIIPPELREAHLKGVSRYLATGQGQILGRRVEMQAIRVDGSRIPVELAITEVDVAGQKTFVGFIRDISARRNAETEREQMVGVLSHDLRTPLTAVAVSAGTLLRGDNLSANQRKAATRVVSSAERMRRMINDLLDVTQSRLGGGLAINRRQVELAGFVRQVLEEIRVVHPGRTVDLQAPEACPGSFDADRVAQMLGNLVGNALAHGSADAPVEVKLDCGPQDAILEVSNQGPTIPPELMQVIWEPFRRGRAAEEGKKSGGLGLGLYIVREIVRAHGGTASVTSEGGQTTFSVSLPRR
jgi:PAS domain S-box-containing protein